MTSSSRNCVSASSTVLDASNKNQHGSDLLHTDQNSSCLDGQNYRNKTLYRAKATQAKKSSQSTQLSWPRLLGTVWALPPPFWTPPIKTSTDLICFTQTKILHASMGKTIGIKRCIEQKLPRQKNLAKALSCHDLNPCANFSDTLVEHSSDLKDWIGHVLTACIRTENQNQESCYPFWSNFWFCSIELTLRHLRYHGTLRHQAFGMWI